MPQLGFWLALPLLAAQALRVRREALRMPEAEGARVGATANEVRLNLLCLGDSIMAGVGCERIDQAFAGALAHGLDARGLACRWRSLARSGLRTAELRALVEGSDGEFDLVVISSGVNDVTALRTRAQFARDLQGLISALDQRWPGAMVVHLGLPPMQRFPALPQPLRSLIGLRAEALDRVAAQCARRLGYLHLPMPVDVDTPDFAADGFHPNATACARWADATAQAIAAHEALARWRA